MNIDDLNKQEKSAILIKAMGLFIDYNISNWSKWEQEQLQYEANSKKGLNFYKSINYALAWRVHLWALNHEEIRGRYYRWCRGLDDRPWWIEVIAQEVMLDKILSLCIKAGLVKLESKR